MDKLATWLVKLKIATQEIHQALSEMEETVKAMDEELRHQLGIERQPNERKIRPPKRPR